MAFYVIHIATGLSSVAYKQAIDFGPPEVASRRDPAELLSVAGFSDIVSVDVTNTFLKTAQALLATRERYSSELRVTEGENAFEEEQAKKRGITQSIKTGLLRRSLLVAIRPLIKQR